MLLYVTLVACQLMVHAVFPKSQRYMRMPNGGVTAVQSVKVAAIEICSGVNIQDGTFRLNIASGMKRKTLLKSNRECVIRGLTLLVDHLDYH